MIVTLDDADHLTTDAVDWDLQRPCDDCPFRRSSPFHEGVASGLVGYGESIANGTFAHTCHKTDKRTMCDGPKTWTGRTKICAGSVMMLLKSTADDNAADRTTADAGYVDWMQQPVLQAIDDGRLTMEQLVAMEAEAIADDDVFTFRELVGFYADECQRFTFDTASDTYAQNYTGTDSHGSTDTRCGV